MTASEMILQKALVGSNLDSSQWNRIQAALRNRAFFSSQVARVDILQALRARVADYAKGHSDLSLVRMDARGLLEALGYRPSIEDAGTIKDLFSEARLNAIIKTNVAQARGYMQYIEGMTPGAYAAFPAQEFRRIRYSRVPRQDWPQRWAKAGGKIYNGRMIALKDDPVWERLSVFGNPYPPYDWGSGMGVLDVDRKTALRLGLIDADALKARTDELQHRPAPDFNAGLESKIEGLTNRDWQGLKDAFGDQITRKGDSIAWCDCFKSRPAAPVKIGGGLIVRPEDIAHVEDDLLCLLPALFHEAPDADGVRRLETLTGKLLEVRI